MTGALILLGPLLVLAGLITVVRPRGFLRFGSRVVTGSLLTAGAILLLAGVLLAAARPEPVPIAAIVRDADTFTPPQPAAATQTPRISAPPRSPRTPGPSNTPALTRTSTPTPSSSTASGAPTILTPLVPGEGPPPAGADNQRVVEATPATPLVEEPQFSSPADIPVAFALPSQPTAALPTSTPAPTRTAVPPPSPTSTVLPPSATPTIPPPSPTRTPTVPTPTRTSTPLPPTPTLTPTVIANVSCNQVGAVQICAWVSNPTPERGTKVTVSGRVVADGARSGVAMHSTWHYKSAKSSCDGSSNDSGVASCQRNIGSATVGFAVAIDVEMTYEGRTYKAITSFTPR